MKSAFKSFTLITISVFICLGFTWLYLRGKGYGKTVLEPVDHPMINQTIPIGEYPYLIAYQGGSKERPENTILAFDHAASLHPNLLLWVDVRPTRDEELVAFSGQNLSRTTNGEGWIGYTDYKDIADLDAAYHFQDETGQFPYRGQGIKIPKLQEILERYPDRQFILNIQDYKPGLDQRIVELIDALNAGSRIIIQSKENGLLKDLREKKSMWAFGTSQAQITQMRMLISIGLESMAPIKGDVYISETQKNEIPLLPDTTIYELQRRKIKIFAGPVASQDDAQLLVKKGVQGIITARPSALVPASSSASSFIDRN